MIEAQSDIQSLLLRFTISLSLAQEKGLSYLYKGLYLSHVNIVVGRSRLALCENCGTEKRVDMLYHSSDSIYHVMIQNRARKIF